MTTIDAALTDPFPAALAAEGTVFLDGSGGRVGSASLLFRNPVRMLVAHEPEEIVPLLAAVEEAADRGLHAAGFLSYEAGSAFWGAKFPELRPAGPLPGGVPLAWFGLYETAESIPGEKARSWTGSDAVVPRLTPGEPSEAFEDRVRDIRHLIHEGDVYQVNHTTRFHAHFDGSVVDLYRTVRSRQPVAFGGLLRCGAFDILSFSPELFFEQRGRRISAEPMKGTAPRGQTAAQDEQLSAWLGTDEKNRAENLMIVDLLRNDLSVVCEPGSVTVPQRFAVQSLPSVHQMTSRIEGQLREGTDLVDIIRALFPCGSITGAPKVRAMRRIAELEAGPRGVYCGAIGYVSGSGAERRSVFSVAIRTAVLSGTDLTLGAGGGIVWDSDPVEEYRETMLKTRFFSSAEPADLQQGVRLIETMRAHPDGSIPWLGFHLDRLGQSATDLGFDFDAEAIRECLGDALTAAASSSSGWRVRLLLDPHGGAQVEASPLEDPGPDPLPICLSGIRIASGHPRYHHKTTDREAYDRARSTAMAAACYDALLVNERGEITEGAITNVFVRKGEEWFTPPLSSGLLAGIGRRVFLLRHAVRERVLYPVDLREADEIRVTNAIIGERLARWVDMPDNADTE